MSYHNPRVLPEQLHLNPKSERSCAATEDSPVPAEGLKENLSHEEPQGALPEEQLFASPEGLQTSADIDSLQGSVGLDQTSPSPHGLDGLDALDDPNHHKPGMSDAEIVKALSELESR
jgi:hypothetical protein